MSKAEKIELNSIKDKIIFGVDRAFKKMIEEAKLSNRELVIAVNGVPKRVRAKDIK